jgi:hypothetical protein
VKLKEEYRTGLTRGLLIGAVAAVLTFFAQWPLDPGMRELISATVVAGVTPLAGLLGYSALDARKGNGP